MPSPGNLFVHIPGPATMFAEIAQTAERRIPLVFMNLVQAQTTSPQGDVGMGFGADTARYKLSNNWACDRKVIRVALIADPMGSEKWG